MKLLVRSRYRSGRGSFEPGQELELTEDEGAFLLRDSPGSFALAGSAAAVTPRSAAEPASTDEDEAEEDDDAFNPLGAMSTETASGLTVPDRRARGGQRRS